MNVSDFAQEYERMADEPLLCMWADRETLVPEAAIALENELHRRGLKKQDAVGVKKRLDALAARESKGPLGKQVALAKYEHNMRHFVGAKEPEFYTPYGGRDIRGSFVALFALAAVIVFRVEASNWGTGLCLVTIAGSLIALVGARELGSRLMRKLDWNRYGSS